jgi:hypothetical protein
MAAFTGTLRSNEIFAALFNMIISQDVFADNIAGIPSLVDKARVDGSLYGDTKLYYATDALKSVAWANDAAATNLLALNRPAAPKCQAITINQFRQISLTVDEYLSKRAWSTEGAFSAFNSVMLGWINDTKRIYDATTYNAYFGTAVSHAKRATVTVPLAAITATGEEKARLEAQTVAQTVANLLTDMTDISSDFNDYGFLRSYSEGDIKIVWNSAWLNKITKLDLPTIFHKDGVMDKFTDKLPARYFGTVNTAATKGDGAKVRSLVEQDIGSTHYFAGDLIHTTDTAPAGTSYTQSDTVICKVVVKLPPYMSAFEVGTSFFNPKSLTENHYLTFGRNTLAYLEAYPLITLVAA